MLKFLYEHLHKLRRAVQILVVLVFIAVPILNDMGITIIFGTLYSISIGNLDIVDPALTLQNILMVKELPVVMLLGALIPLAVALLLGRVFCGWACPYNLIAEYGDKLRRKLRPKSVKKQNRNPKNPIYWIVFGIIFLVLMITGLPLVTYFSLPGLITAQMADLLFLGTVGIEILLVLVILLLEVFLSPRFWCRFVCPVGATLALARSGRTMRVNFDAEKCTCAPAEFPCNKACPIDLNPRKAGIYPYCFNCGECVDTCRSFGKALTFTMQPLEERNINLNHRVRELERS
ncbi:MAG: 4Fe-4S binding protein [Calditrichaeota bacterium]|nr:4Fe-4S binding protein [Calditrichota bacterium]